MNDQDKLSQSLHEHASRVGSDAPIGFDEVRRSARRIQRRRRAVAGLAAAAVVAVAVPLGLGVSGLTDSAPPPVAGSPTVAPSTSSTPSSVPSTPPTTAAEPTTRQLTTKDAGRSYPPKVAWLEGRTLHRADGSTTTLPRAYDDVVAFHGGWLGVRQGGPNEPGLMIDTVDAGGTVVDSQLTSYGLTLSADGTQVVWMTDQPATLHRGITSGMSDAVDTMALPKGAYGPVGFVGGDRVLYVVSGPTSSVHATDLAGSDTVLPGLVGVGAGYQPDDLVAGMTSAEDTGSCWSVRTLTSDEERWHTCDFSLGRFSPDGRYVVGYPPYRDGIGDSDIAILDARTGAVVQHWQRRGNDIGFTAQQVQWEDGHTLLTSWFEDGHWSILRLGDDGSVSTAAGPVAGAMEDAPLRVPTQP
jgi:hypothetical protein